MLSLIAVIGRNRELGKDNQLLWHIPGDLPRFKKITSGHPIIMGRKTYESIGKPLVDRTNIVITSNSSNVTHLTHVIIAVSVEDAMKKARASVGSEEIFVIGGGKVFAETIDIADRLYLTIVDKAAEADTFFPEYSKFARVIAKQPQDGYTYLMLEK